MDTSVYKTKDYGEVTVFHHGDYGGEAHVIWRDGEGQHEARLPAELLTQVGKQFAYDKLSAELTRFMESQS